MRSERMAWCWCLRMRDAETQKAPHAQCRGAGLCACAVCAWAERQWSDVSRGHGGGKRAGSGRAHSVSPHRQAALEITARYCRNEMEQYGRCVAASPTSWQTDCHSLRLSMSRCAATHPIVQRIREDCAEPFVAFEQCLKENQESVLNCSEHVNAFLRCAERVKLPA
ncbi:coiled-coil-helix-coiled-coil-helix domain-containing protein 5 [Tympanuchus pallidicinctus]|uniref:coiled-coil-helix-coiled-coil-helix domain-containing protein 5 n=1 Tax=Tympanuchus pallidicinctus TaxID=109042 RepID=UPI002286D347|nr:coiled-coil-helix-coiled-coil-helix domain-containing protein 5 [Tympanuchus pallidicinctus]